MRKKIDYKKRERGFPSSRLNDKKIEIRSIREDSWIPKLGRVDGCKIASRLESFTWPVS